MLTTKFWCSGPNKDSETNHPEVRSKQDQSFFMSVSVTITEAWLKPEVKLHWSTENIPQVHLDTVLTMQENQESHMDTYSWADAFSFPFLSHCQYNSVQMASKTPCMNYKRQPGLQGCTADEHRGAQNHN